MELDYKNTLQYIKENRKLFIGLIIAFILLISWLSTR